jgi:hypothetical protein
MSIFALTPSEIEKAVIEIMAEGLVPFVKGSPGLGKSSIFRNIAKKGGLVYLDNRLSQMTPEDFMGLPMKVLDEDGQSFAEFVPFTMFPTTKTVLPKGKNGWFIALDEFNSASKSVQAASYKVVLDRFVGQHELHSQAFIACAGNLDTDRAIVNVMSTAMKSRLIHLTMRADLGEFTKYAHQNGFDSRIMGFLEFQPGKLHDFRPDTPSETFPCPRTWEFCSKLIKGKDYADISKSIVAGTIGEGCMVEFMTFLKEFDHLPSYATIVSDPLIAPVPSNPSTRYALVTMLLDKLEPKDFGHVVKYVTRLSTEFQAVFFRNSLDRYPKLRREPSFIANINTFTKFVNNIPDAA